MANTVNIVVTAKDEASGTLDSIGGKMGSVAKVGAVALASVGVAAAGMATKGLVEFGKFQSGMNEVFTLLPGISQDAMGKMEGQVKSFSREFGVLPEQAIPALYQALSAGVPPNNVFEFLETAQKAAKGGVTELATAVDGISSVVNAYGDDMIDATKASDLMFTAVKLGKTDFEQLSSSLFNVVPTAASMGVQFEDVTAALARMTAQGTPTSVATTQLRAAFVEASKSGTNLDKALRELHGKGFAQLIESGMNTGDIFESLRSSMPEQEFKDLFGSVEAMNAALAITGPQAEGFQDALSEMQGSAGATDAAFQQMSGGLSDSMAKIKANIAVLWIEIGEKLAPVVEKLLTWLIEKGIPAVTSFGQALREKLAGPAAEAAEFFRTVVIPALQEFADFAGEKFREFVGYYESDLKPAFENIQTAVATTVQFFIDNWDKINKVVGPMIDQFVNVVTTAVDTIKLVLGIVIDLLGGDFSGAWDKTKELLETVTDFWKDTIANAFDFIKGLAGLALDAGKALFDALLEGAQNLWTETIWPWIKGLPGEMKDLLIGGGGSLWDAGSELGKQLLKGLGNALGKTAGFAGDVASAVLKAVKNVLNTYVIDKINRGLEFSIPVPFAPDIHINPPDIPRLARGMFKVPGPAGAGDIFPAMLSPGEMVVPAPIAERIRAGGAFGGGRVEGRVSLPPVINVIVQGPGMAHLARQLRVRQSQVFA